MNADVLLTLGEVMQRTKFAESTIYAKARKGEFPRPAKFGGASRWRERDVQAYIDAQFAARESRA